MLKEGLHLQLFTAFQCQVWCRTIFVGQVACLATMMSFRAGRCLIVASCSLEAAACLT